MSRPPIKLPWRHIEAATQAMFEEENRQILAAGIAMSPQKWHEISQAERDRRCMAMLVGITAFLRVWL